MKCPKCEGNLVATVSYLGDEEVEVIFQCEDQEEHCFFTSIYNDGLEDN